MSMEQLQADLVMLHAMQEEEKRVNARALKLKTDMRLIELRVMQEMGEMGITSVGHAGLLAKITKPIYYKPIAGDATAWQRIYARIQRTGEFDLLHRRLSSTAVRERFKAGDPIDGIEQIEVPELDLTFQGEA